MFISELGWQSCGARKATCRQHNCCWNCWDKSKEEKAEGKKSCCKVAKVLQVEEEERVWKNGSRRKNLVQIEEGEHPILFLYVHTNGCKVLTGWQQWKPITGSATLSAKFRNEHYPIKRPTCHITIVLKDTALYEKYVVENSIRCLKKTGWIYKKKSTDITCHNMYSSGGVWDKK